MVVARGWEEGEMGSYYLMHIEVQFYKIKELWKWMVVVHTMNILNTTELLT